MPGSQATERQRMTNHAKGKMMIGIGSMNPVKIRAARAVISRIHPRAGFVALDVPSNVNIQPIGEDETIRGAVNRAQGVLAESDARWGVGLEAGIIESRYGMMTTAWCAIVDRSGRVGIGGATNMLLPETVASQIRSGAELGDAMDSFSGIRDVKRKMGAIGILTKGLTDRRASYEQIVKLALARFLWEDW